MSCWIGDIRLGMGGRLRFAGVVALRVVFLRRCFWDALWVSGGRGFFGEGRKGGGGDGLLGLSVASLGVEGTGPRIPRLSGRT